MVVAMIKCYKRQSVNTYNKYVKTDATNLKSTKENNENKDFCANNNNNNNNNNNKNLVNISNKQMKQDKRCNYNSLFVIQLTYAICFVLFMIIGSVGQVETAAVFLNADFHSHPRFEPLCNKQQEHFIESDGKESSLILEFKAGPATEHKKSCTRILSAPPGYGFIVRLILPKIRRGHHHATALTTPVSSEENTSAKSTIGKLNATSVKTTVSRKCPMSIFSSLDPHTPQWRVDPCQLEDTAPEMDDPVRLFHGRVRIIWEHNNQHLHSKLMVTVLGKGEQCNHESKHQCLKIGDEPILCISKELECDGIRHCPVSNEYDSDEDYRMCWKHRRFSDSMPPAMESEIFEHFAMEVFRNLFAFDAPQMPDSTALATTTSLPSLSTRLNSTTTEGGLSDLDLLFINAENITESAILPSKRNNTRSGLHSDLSKYGPWGYLMLGMLLCGGALLICGLWASASQSAVNNERESAMQQGATAGSGSDASRNLSPPNYDELDPPPAYSVLFPNQKASNATLSSMAGAVAASTTTTTTTNVPTSASNNDQVPSSSQPRFSIEGGPGESIDSTNDSTI